MKEVMQWHVNITGTRHTTNALLLKLFYEMHRSNLFVSPWHALVPSA